MFRGTILVYHGFRSCIEDQRIELRWLAKAGFLAVGVDAVGHGQRGGMDLENLPSEGVRELVVRTASEIPRLLLDLEEVQPALGPFGITGTSMGGYIAYEAVLRERARRADRRKFDEVMSRAGGTPPRDGDELPEH